MSINTNWWKKLPRFVQGVIVIAGLWTAYRVTVVFFPDLWMEIMGFLGLGSGALMMSGKHKALRQKEILDTNTDKLELLKTQEEIARSKAELSDLVDQQTSVMLSTDKELEDELHRLSEAKREIAESNMTEAQAEAFLRERLNNRKKS